jgi:hypothetical protein
MNIKWSLCTLTLTGLILFMATTGCRNAQGNVAWQPTALAVPEETHTATPTPTLTTTPPVSAPRRSQPQATPAGVAESHSLTADRTPEATHVPPPTPTPTQEPPKAEVVVEAGNVRSGPGLAYPVVGQVNQRDILLILKRDEAGNWLQIAWTEEPTSESDSPLELSGQVERAWLSASLVRLNKDVSSLEMAEALTPPPAPPTATPHLIQVPYCDSVPIRGFGQVWGAQPEIAATLGCPSWPYSEEGTDAAVQIFEHGLMLWLAADSSYSSDPVYVLFDTGEFQRFPDLGPADPAAIGDVPAGFHALGERFSKAYWEGTGARVRQRLGYATSSSMDSPGAYQQFGNGRMLWIGVVDRIFVLYDYWKWDESGEDSVQVRSWIGLQDTFGD